MELNRELGYMDKFRTKSIFITDMKKNPAEPKSFGKAMFSIAELCQDYDSIGQPPASNPIQVQKPLEKRMPCLQPPVKKSVPKQPPVQAPKQPIKQVSKGVVLKQPIKSVVDELTLNPKKLQKQQLSQLISTHSKVLTNSSQPLETKHAVLPIQQFLPNPHMQFFYEGHDLRQGQLGDCYLISAISCLANKGNILNRCIQYLPPNLINPSKQFVCHIFDSGSMVDVKVKNQFSINQNTLQPAYVKPIGGDITPLVIQKAYAQIYGGYNNIVLGFSCDALRDLSGAPTEYIDLEDKNLVQKIKDAFEMGYVLTISSKINPVNEGINKRHCYVICDYKNEKGALWLQLRNPSGYTPLNPIVKEPTSFKHDLLQENGLIWLPYSYILQNFEVISSCLIHPKYHYRYKAVSSQQLGNSNQKCFMLETNQVVHGYITLHQLHSRHFKQSDYSYQVGKLIIAKIQRVKNNSYKVLETVAGHFSCKQTCSVEVNLTPGRYFIYAQLNSIHKLLDKNRVFTLSFYTSNPQFELYDTEPTVPDALLLSYVKNHEEEFQITKTDKMIRYFGTLFGYVIILFQNLSAVTAYIDILYDSKNVKAQTNKVVVNPKGMTLVKNLIGRENNCSHKCNIKVNTVYK